MRDEPIEQQGQPRLRHKIGKILSSGIALRGLFSQTRHIAL